MNTTAHQATMHSSSHKENDVSEWARTRRDFLPDHQTTLRNNVAASDFRGQTENNKSESVKSGPISSRTRSKKAAQASSAPGCATACLLDCLRGDAFISCFICFYHSPKPARCSFPCFVSLFIDRFFMPLALFHKRLPFQMG